MSVAVYRTWKFPGSLGKIPTTWGTATFSSCGIIFPTALMPNKHASTPHQHPGWFGLAREASATS